MHWKESYGTSSSFHCRVEAIIEFGLGMQGASIA